MKEKNGGGTAVRDFTKPDSNARMATLAPQSFLAGPASLMGLTRKERF